MSRTLSFVSSIGAPLQPRNTMQKRYWLLTRAGLPRRKCHVTRQTATSHFIVDCGPLRVVMQLVGHSQISTTANNCGYVFDAALQEAANAMDHALGTGT